MSDDAALGLARDFLDGNANALVRLVETTVRRGRPPFREWLLEFVSEEAQGLARNDYKDIVVRVCRLCMTAELYTGHTQDEPRLAHVPCEVKLPEADWEIFTTCWQCQTMSGRYPEMMSFLERASKKFWKIAGAPS